MIRPRDDVLQVRRPTIPPAFSSDILRSNDLVELLSRGIQVRIEFSISSSEGPASRPRRVSGPWWPVGSFDEFQAASTNFSAPPRRLPRTLRILVASVPVGVARRWPQSRRIASNRTCQSNLHGTRKIRTLAIAACFSLAPFLPIHVTQLIELVPPFRSTNRYRSASRFLSSISMIGGRKNRNCRIIATDLSTNSTARFNFPPQGLRET